MVVFLSEKTNNQVRSFSQCRPCRKALRFAGRFSTQLGFGAFMAIFLVVSVGEGRAYDPSILGDVQLTYSDSADYIGRPQVMADQTILTGEVQQNLAITYTVEQGDSLVSIAKRYDISVGTLMDTNHITATTAEKIRPGSELTIPAEDTNTSLAWLDEINAIKAEQERQRQEAERQRLLAQQRRSTTTSLGRITSRLTSTHSYQVIGVIKQGTGWCTWYVNYKRPDLPSGMGNAGQYIVNARRYGLATSNTPAPGRILVTNESAWGHVAIVESVQDDTVTITEMNYAGRHIVTRRTISRNSPIIKGYVN